MDWQKEQVYSSKISAEEAAIIYIDRQDRSSDIGDQLLRAIVPCFDCQYYQCYQRVLGV